MNHWLKGKSLHVWDSPSDIMVVRKQDLDTLIEGRLNTKEKQINEYYANHADNYVEYMKECIIDKVDKYMAMKSVEFYDALERKDFDTLEEIYLGAVKEIKNA